MQHPKCYKWDGQNKAFKIIFMKEMETETETNVDFVFTRLPKILCDLFKKVCFNVNRV